MDLNSPGPKNFRLYTLGCKVNQYETQAIREALERKGIRDAEGEKGTVCDFVVLNTCTVTEDADKTNRYWIRRLRREHPGARLAVTGCYVQKNHEEIRSMPEVDLIIPNEEKAVLADRLIEGTECGTRDFSADGSFLPLSISRSEGRTRAYVKIQDGCNNSCSFCKVSIVRGRSRSRALADICEEVTRLRDGGYREIILTGIQLGAYGLDLKPSENNGRLRNVIESCAKVEGIERIRLSSIEVMDLAEPVREALRSVPKLCPHLHIPLQSGDNEVLRRMNRRYTRELYRDVILELKQKVADFEFSADVMVGFPGETEEQFGNTAELLKLLKPLKTHIFPYSRREGTRAASWEAAPVREIRKRARRLIELADRISREAVRGYLGRSLEVLVEHKAERAKFWEGRTRNYLKVFFEFPRNVQGCIIPLVLEELMPGGCAGRMMVHECGQENKHRK